MIICKNILDVTNIKECCCYIGVTGIIEYFANYGQRHSLIGPAIIYTNGDTSFYINNVHVGRNLSNEEFKNIVKKIIFSS